MITSPGNWRPLNGLVRVIGMEFYATRPCPRLRNGSAQRIFLLLIEYEALRELLSIRTRAFHCCCHRFPAIGNNGAPGCLVLAVSLPAFISLRVGVDFFYRNHVIWGIAGKWDFLAIV